MKARARSLVLLSLVVCLALAVSGMVSAYTPRPGVLSPDEVDFGGKTVNILVGDLHYVVFNGGLPLQERIAEAEELFNVKIQTGNTGGAEAMIARILAGDSTYDIFRFEHRGGYFPLVTQGMLLPVSTILPDEYFESLPRADRYTIEKLRYQGELYGFGVTYDTFNGSMMITMYNRDLFIEAGLEEPYDLWKEGRWTYDEMERLGIALTQDTDGDGVIDQWGIGDLGNPAAVYRFLPSNGAEVAKQKDGKWVYSLNDADAIHVLNTVNRWRNELQIMGSGDFLQGKVAIAPHTHIAGARHAINAGMNIGYVPQPRGPHVETNRQPTFDFAANFLPVNAAEPEKLIALADFLFREGDGGEYLDFYINSYMRSREHMEAYMACADNWQGEGDIFQWSGLWDITDEQVSLVINNEKGAAQATDEVEQQAQAFLDELFGQ